MSTSPDSRTTFADSDPASADELSYRAISPAAIATLILGLASPLAFLSPLLWTIPVAALGLGWYALGRLQRDADRYTGGRLVAVGMLIALLFLGWAPARYLQRLSILESRASALAKEWVKLVCDGRLQEAHQWHLHSAARAAPGVSVASFYAERPEMAKLQAEYFGGGVLRNWTERGPGTEAEYIRYLGRESVTGGENYVFEFSIRGGKNQGRGNLAVFVVVTREPRETGGGELFVANVLGMNPFIRER